MPELFVTNFNKNYTGVSSTAAGVVAAQAKQYDVRLVGQPLPDAPQPITRSEAVAMSRQVPEGRPFIIWHVRRNTEMRAAMWARDVLRLPIKIVFTTAAQRRHSAFPRWLISKMDAVIATSPGAAAHSPNTVAIVPHGINTERFTPSPNRDEIWKELGYGGTRGIVNVGRIRPEKGTDRFVDAMIEVLPDSPGVTALVIGKAQIAHKAYEADLKRRVERAGLADRLIFTGEISGQDMPKLLQGITLLCASPRYEGWGVTPLEAMACGAPFVATDEGFFSELSAGGRAGYVVPAQDLASCLKKTLADQEAYARLSLGAREVAIERFSIQAEANGIAKVYEELWSS